ncbi:MAG: amidohydrolase family protein [Dethiobacteria bacterium]|nr:amidohydrolase family protein [Dethiobacteria bacterium]
MRGGVFLIIDVHTHLGDILYPGGGELIYEKGARKKITVDLISMAEAGLYKTNAVMEWLLVNLFETQITKAAQARNKTATLENMRSSMDEVQVGRNVCLPIAPNLLFEDLLKASEVDAGIIPFTTVDFTNDHDVEAILKKDVERGAKGLKLHPIIQKEPLNSKKTYDAVEAFAQFKLPVLFHSGIQSYYLGELKATVQAPLYGGLHFARELVASFPEVSFIAGHAGLFQYKDAMELLGEFKNVYVDTSFQASERVKELISAFGPERVMYGSDWPWGSRTAAMTATRKACNGDKSLEKLIFSENAQQLLKLEL